jgi:hypothetical protein
MLALDEPDVSPSESRTNCSRQAQRRAAVTQAGGEGAGGLGKCRPCTISAERLHIQNDAATLRFPITHALWCAEHRYWVPSVFENIVLLWNEAQGSRLQGKYKRGLTSCFRLDRDHMLHPVPAISLSLIQCCIGTAKQQFRICG